MNAADVLAAAERNAVARAWGRRALFTLAGLTLLGAMYCAGQRSQSSADAIAQSIQRTDTLMVERAAAVETVTVIHRETVRAEAIATAYHDTVTVVARDTVELLISNNGAADSVVRVEIPPVVVARIVADSVLITDLRAGTQALSALVQADSGVIASQGHTIDLQSKQHGPACGVRCGIVIGATATGLLVKLVTLVIHH